MAGRLNGKVAIVTGAGGGIGRATAMLLASEGASVLVNDIGSRTGADAHAVVAQIVAAGGVAVANQTSATWDGAEAIVQHALDAFGRIDILINNATIATRRADLWDVTEAEWDVSTGVNLKGYFAMIRAATPHLARQGSGAIVNLSSGAGFGAPAMVAYSAGKEGVIGLTRTVARELGRFGVRCNAVRPLALGIATDQYAASIVKWAKLMALTVTPAGKTSEMQSANADTHPPDKVAQLLVWLCTDAANDVNGRTFHARGDTIALFTEPVHEREIHREGGWSLDTLDQVAGTELVDGLTNAFRFDEHPDLQKFDEAVS